MPFVLKKNSGSYEWPVTVESPSSGGKFRKDTFKALFKKLSRSEFGALAEQGEDALVTEILDGWKDVKDEEVRKCHLTLIQWHRCWMIPMCCVRSSMLIPTF